jgi:5,10-methylenetetrahydromethanopterin reductase
MNRFKNAAPPAGPVELYVGALGPGMLAVAGAVGDGVCLNLMPPEVVPRQLAATGRDDGFGVMTRLQVLITDDLASARTMLRETMLAAYLAQPVYNNFLSWMGYAEEAAAIAAGWARRDREAVTRAIHDRLVDDLTVLGDRSKVLDRIDEYFAAGVQQAAISVLATDRATVESTLRALAP